MRVIYFIPMITILVISLIGDAIISTWQKIDSKLQVNLLCTGIVISSIVVLGNLIMWWLS